MKAFKPSEARALANVEWRQRLKKQEARKMEKVKAAERQWEKCNAEFQGTIRSMPFEHETVGEDEFEPLQRLNKACEVYVKALANSGKPLSERHKKMIASVKLGRERIKIIEVVEQEVEQLAAKVGKLKGLISKIDSDVTAVDEDMLRECWHKICSMISSLYEIKNDALKAELKLSSLESKWSKHLDINCVGGYWRKNMQEKVDEEYNKWI